MGLKKQGKITMPSKSDSQQKFFRIVLAYKKGETDDVSQEVKDAAADMSEEQIRDFLKKESAAAAAGYITG